MNNEEKKGRCYLFHAAKYRLRPTDCGASYRHRHTLSVTLSHTHTRTRLRLSSVSYETCHRRKIHNSHIHLKISNRFMIFHFFRTNSTLSYAYFSTSYHLCPAQVQTKHKIKNSRFKWISGVIISIWSFPNFVSLSTLLNSFIFSLRFPRLIFSFVWNESATIVDSICTVSIHRRAYLSFRSNNE